MTITIAQKQSGTGTIHDIASEHYDREIDFGDSKYALVEAAYYGDSYECFDDYHTAVTAQYSSDFSSRIIDRRGQEMY